MSDATPTTAYAHGPGGLLSQPGLGGKRAARLKKRVRVKAWSPEARAAALAARRRNAGMMTPESGNAPNADARNLASARREAAQLRKVPKPPKIAAPKHGGGGKGGGKKPKGPKALTPKQQAVQARRAAAQAARDQKLRDKLTHDVQAQMDRAAAAAAKPPKGGGGGGGKKTPTPEEKRTAQQQQRQQTAADTAPQVGLAPADVDTLRQAAEQGGAQSDRLSRSGLIDSDGQATDAGRMALNALERGDVRGYQAAIQNARGTLDRAQARSDRLSQQRQARADRLSAQQQRDQRQNARDAQRESDRQTRSDRQASQDAQRAQDRADRIAARRERAVPRARSHVVTKAHAMSRDEEKAMFAAMGRAGTLRGRTGAAAGGGPARKPTPAETQTHAAIPAKVKPGTTVGDTTKAFGADPNTSYQLRHELVDMKDIEASNTGGGGINPNYDPALQPRDRSRASSQAQIGQVAQNLNPEVLTTDFHRIDAGSPIVDASGNVLSGNGRTLALQRAAELHPAQYAAYRAAIKAEARAHGIDPAMVDKMENPVLVRRLAGGADPAAFAREANSSGTLRMSPLEQAKVDAGQISDSHMLKLNVTEGQDIDRALRDKSNKPFIDEFLKTVPDNERANLLTRNGDLNQMGLYRAKAAIYTRAFPGESGERLAESMLESLDPEVKSIQNGISGALPSFSHATALTRSGMRDPSLDISEDIAKTIDVYARIKDNPALTAGTPASQLVAKYLGQSSMFDRELNGEQERLLVYLDKISKKPTEVRSFLDRYAKIVEDQPPPGQANLFGDAGNLTRAQLFDTLLGGTQVPEVQNQAGMF